MSEEKKSYRQIMKTTSIFGGVQVFTIIVGIVRSKIVAVLLGASGIGTIGLFQTTLSMIQSITGLGLSSSAVRSISEANGTNDEVKIALVVKTLRRWVWVTGMIGATATLSFAPLLSKWTFGNEKYTWSFVWLSIICLLSAISSGQIALLQGMRRIRQMAKSSLWGSILGLVTAVPLYYYFGINGIVPSLIIVAASSLLLSHYFAGQIPVKQVEQTWSDAYYSGLGMAKLGVIMMLSGFMVTLVSYIVNLYISNKGGLTDVGLYSAGWNVTNQYTSLIFTAMATDYFPRLASINSDNDKMKLMVNQQAEISLLIIAPLLVCLIGFVPIVIRILYTPQFLPITGMIKWNMLGMLFKASSWAIAFIIVAKGDNRLFFITETTANVIILIFNILGYSFWGIEGVGISFASSYLFYFIIVFVLVKQKYDISYLPVFWRIFIVETLFVIVVFLLSVYLSGLYLYSFAVLVFIASCIYSFVELNKRMELMKLFRTK